MKRCPQCHRVETDDTLVYCRVDGATLISDSGSVAGEVGTAKFGSAVASSEIETCVLPHRTDASDNRPTAPTTVLPVTATPSKTGELTKPKPFQESHAVVVRQFSRIRCLSGRSAIPDRNTNWRTNWTTANRDTKLDRLGEELNEVLGAQASRLHHPVNLRCNQTIYKTEQARRLRSQQ